MKAKSGRINIFWFRRDLRLNDNCGLFHALKSSNPVLPVFIFDTDILDKLEEKKDARVEFIHRAIEEIHSELTRLGSTLFILHSKPADAFKKLAERFDIEEVFTNRDYEPDAIKRDMKVKDCLDSGGIKFNSFKDQVIFEKEEITKADGSPYSVYTPYGKKWKSALKEDDYESYNTRKYFRNFVKTEVTRVPALDEIGFLKTGIRFPSKELKKDIIKQYHKTRDYPAAAGTTRLSVHLRFGTVSIRELVSEAVKLNETWLNELIWREFFMMILYHFPQVAAKCFRAEYENIKWRNDEKEFEAWCKGKTGYPIVDAGMRELNLTGYMHNRTRMITAGFLTKHLLIDWRWGERYFASRLLDYELSSNNGNWQWAAGTGCDAAPYFRIFNPLAQTKKFDPDLTYVKRWVPEFGSADYPKPIVEHKYARNRALEAYSRALRIKVY